MTIPAHSRSFSQNIGKDQSNAGTCPFTIGPDPFAEAKAIQETLVLNSLNHRHRDAKVPRQAYNVALS